MTQKTFINWLTTQRKRGDAVAALANRARADLYWPRKARSLAALERYLEPRASPEELAALHQAWAEWEAQR